jgi:hypothetical protein
LLHLPHCALAYLAAVVQYAVDRPLTQSCLYRYLADPVRMPHISMLAGFWRFFGICPAAFSLRMTCLTTTSRRNASWI